MAIPVGKTGKDIAFSRETHREATHAPNRAYLAEYVRKNGVGAEIGVFWAHFSEVILKTFAPAKFYLVDPYHRLHGETYPAWGPYTDKGRLRVAETLDAAKAVRDSAPDVVELREQFSTEFLAEMPVESLDWVYLDAGHKYEMVRDDLAAILPRLKPDGVILGDDYFADPNSAHGGVKQAVDEFAKAQGFELIVGKYCQYVLRRPAAQTA
ncbi:class I SAM-dependent methyltransferase [Stagnihabitans tardus]|uniref:Class I SAM-dependent methyltransferase n=1 Tax=Stagnihabitans tardus TaxID=2699202 RepID=A0AAE4YBQ7_9RHOB|nr:class I SAM-dependent methyltransferase [Stagnihabitans tardus]NBZ88313.1 hypothetical protein [Stagnihabitans tardus]